MHANSTRAFSFRHGGPRRFAAFAFSARLPYRPGPSDGTLGGRARKPAAFSGLFAFLTSGVHQMAQITSSKAEVRDRVGKGAARAVRRQDKIPAVIYGDKKPAIAITRSAARGDCPPACRRLPHPPRHDRRERREDPRHSEGLSARPGARFPDARRLPARCSRRAAHPRGAGALHERARLRPASSAAAC